MKQIALQVFSCPKYGKGKPTVRFLGNPRGLITHWGKGRPEACPGPEDCHNHHLRGKWRGYAPVQIWNAQERLWQPYVLEMSSGLIELLGMEELRGQCWEIFRVRRSYGDRAIEGKFLREYNSHDLPAAFQVQRTVENLYGNRNIFWDVPIDGWTREVAECSEDAPPTVEPVIEENVLGKQKFSGRLPPPPATSSPGRNGSAKKT